MKLIAFLFLCLISFQGFSVDHYWSDTGNDANDGLSPSFPKKSVTALNALWPTLSPGDRVLFKRGDVFSFGQKIVINQSGASGNNIVLSAYGTGSNPIISGLAAVSGWSNIGGNIWQSAAISGTNNPNMVTVAGVNTPIGKYPNTGWLTITSKTGLTAITCSALTGTPNYAGGQCVIRDYNWFLSKDTITSQSGSTLYTGNHPYGGYEGTKFLIQSNINTLDVTNEWYFNQSGRILSIYNTATPSNVKISVVDTLIYTGAYNYITIENIDFDGGNIAGICIGTTAANKSGIIVQNCNVTNSGRDAIYATRLQYSQIENCGIDQANNNGIYFNADGGYSNNNKINNCNIYNVGIIIGMMYYRSGALIQMTGVNTQGTTDTITSNNILNVGYNGIRFYYGNNQVNYNYINNFCVSFSDGSADGGGIYTWVGSAATVYSGNLVDHNIIQNPIGVANCLYADDFSNGIDYTNNTTIGGENGVYFHNIKNIGLINNTIYQPLTNLLYIYNDDSLQFVSGLTNTYNEYFTTSYTALMINPFSRYRDDLSTWFTASNFNKFWRPTLPTYKIARYTHRVIPVVSWPATLTGVDYTLPAWQAAFSYDLSSTEGPENSNTPQVFLNTGDVPATINFGANYTIFNGSVINSKLLGAKESVIGLYHSPITPSGAAKSFRSLIKFY